MKLFYTSALTLAAVLLTAGSAIAQNVGIANTTITPDPEAILELRSTTKGVLLPRMNTAQTVTLAASLNAADDGMTVYDTSTKQYKYWNGTTLTWNVLATSATVTGSTLDDAYDAGGAGLGRSITGDAGAVQINGTGGTIALETDGDIQLTTDDAWIGSSPTLQRLRFDDNSSGRIHVEGADLTMDSDRWIGIDGSNPRIEFEGGSGRVNIQNADIEVDDDAWIGLNASNPRIEFDNTNDRLDMRAADIEVDAGKWIGIGSTVERVIFDGSDNQINIMGATGGVGINTEDPDAELDIIAEPGGDPFVIKAVKNSNVASELTGIGLGSEDLSHIVKSGIVHERESPNGTGKLHFLVDDNVDANDVAITESRMTIDRNGLVGIGTTTPAEELHVVGDIRSSVLAGGGNVQADANGNLIVSNNLPGNDDSYIHNQTAVYQTADFQISGDGEMDGGLTIGAGITVDDNNTNGGSIAAGSIAFGNASGEGIGSKRNAGGNQYGLDFYTNSVNRLAITNTGGVGIGTAAPAEELHVIGDFRASSLAGGGNIQADANGTLIVSNDLAAGDGDYIQNQNSVNQGANFRISGDGQMDQVIATANNTWYLQGGDDHTLRDVNVANTLGVWGAQNADRAGIQLGSDGSYIFGDNTNIGIGTTAPAQKLDVRGVVRSEGAYRVDVDGNNGAGPRIAFGTTANEYAFMNMGSYGAINNLETTTRDFRIGSNAHTNAIYLENATGDVGIGTNAPGQRLDVNGNIHLGSSTGNKQIYTWSATDGNWRIGMSDSPGFNRAMSTTHVQYMTYAAGATQGFAVGVNGGNSSFETRGSDHQAYFRGDVGIQASNAQVKLAVGGNGVNQYSTDLWVENNSHVQGNETLNQGGRGRLRVGTAWGYVGLYADGSSTGAANDLVLGAGSGLVRIGPNGGGQNLRVGGLEGSGDRPVYADANGILRTGGSVNYAVSSNLAYSFDDAGGWTNAVSCDDCISGAVNIGFTMNVFGTSYTQLQLSSNGYITFGGSGGPNTLGNGCLPSGTFGMACLMFWWDDLIASTFRYRTVGSSPNRVWQARYDGYQFNNTGEIVDVMISMHEGSNLITVRYDDVGCCGDDAKGGGATIGLQGPGGGSARAIPIGCNAPLTDDNQGANASQFISFRAPF